MPQRSADTNQELSRLLRSKELSRLRSKKRYRKNLRNKLLRSEDSYLYIDIIWDWNPDIHAQIQFKSDLRVFPKVRKSLIEAYVTFFLNNELVKEGSEEEIRSQAAKLPSSQLLTPSTTFFVKELFQSNPTNLNKAIKKMEKGWNQNWVSIPIRHPVNKEVSKRFMCSERKVVDTFLQTYSTPLVLVLQSLENLFKESHNIVFKILHSEPGDCVQGDV